MHQAQIASQMHEMTFGRPGEKMKWTALDTDQYFSSWILSCTTLLPHFCFTVNYKMYLNSENSVGPDQLASEKPADLDLRCFQLKICQCDTDAPARGHCMREKVSQI